MGMNGCVLFSAFLLVILRLAFAPEIGMRDVPSLLVCAMACVGSFVKVFVVKFYIIDVQKKTVL
jgi:predicted neutral ceramidase superfamily lipid hydrolase